MPADALPTDAYFVDFYKLSHYFNGEGVQLFHMPKAHTDGDSIVHFRGTDVIALGDLMSTGSYPVIDVAKGGTINGVIDGLNRVLDMSIAEFRLEGGTLMVPGHGRLVDSADVAYYRDMLTIIRDRVEDLIKKGRTLEQVKTANPSGDYDTEYGIDDRPVDHGELHRGGVQDASAEGVRPRRTTTGGKCARHRRAAMSAALAHSRCCRSPRRCRSPRSEVVAVDAGAQRRKHRPRSISPDNGCRSSLTTGDGAW